VREKVGYLANLDGFITLITNNGLSGFSKVLDMEICRPTRTLQHRPFLLLEVPLIQRFRREIVVYNLAELYRP